MVLMRLINHPVLFCTELLISLGFFSCFCESIVINFKLKKKEDLKQHFDIFLENTSMLSGENIDN